jgi:hypothetical protein
MYKALGSIPSTAKRKKGVGGVLAGIKSKQIKGLNLTSSRVLRSASLLLKYTFCFLGLCSLARSWSHGCKKVGQGARIWSFFFFFFFFCGTGWLTSLSHLLGKYSHLMHSASPGLVFYMVGGGPGFYLDLW